MNRPRSSHDRAGGSPCCSLGSAPAPGEQKGPILYLACSGWGTRTPNAGLGVGWELRLTTLQFLGSVHWKWRATRRMASRRSATSSVCLMFLALSASKSSSPERQREVEPTPRSQELKAGVRLSSILLPKSREVMPDFRRWVRLRTTCGRRAGQRQAHLDRRKRQSFLGGVT